VLYLLCLFIDDDQFAYLALEIQYQR
jgi:hypothetical protein